MPLDLKQPWQPKKIVGNTAYYYNTQTGDTRSVYIPSGELTRRKTEFQQWRNRQAIEKGEIPSTRVIYYNPETGATKYSEIARGNISTLPRDPMAPYDYQRITKRTGIVEKVLSGDRIQVNGVVVKIKYVESPQFQEDKKGWLKAKQFTEHHLLGKEVSLSVNLDNERAANGDTLANVNVAKTGENVFDVLSKAQGDRKWWEFWKTPKFGAWWNLDFWEKFQVTSYWTGAQFANLKQMAKTGKYGKAGWMDERLPGLELIPYHRGEDSPENKRYKTLVGTGRFLADMIFDVANLFAVGDVAGGTKIALSSSAKYGTRVVSLTGKGERQLAKLIKLYNSEYAARREMAYIIETRGKSTAGFVSKTGLKLTGTQIELVPMRYYAQTLGKVKSQIIQLANKVDRPAFRGGTEPFIDRLNRFFRRSTTLPFIPYYVINGLFGVFNAAIGGTKVARYKTAEQSLRYANNPLMKDRVIFTSIYGRKWTTKELELEVKRFKLGEWAGIGDVERNRAYAATNEDKLWEPMLKLARAEENRVRNAMFFDRLQKGDVPELAAAHAYKFQLNYDKRLLTAFEQRYADRLIPFYTTQTRSPALQAEMMVRMPYKYAPIPKVMSASGGRYTESEAERADRAERKAWEYREWEKGAILISHPFKKNAYFRIRAPTEDISQIANKLGTPEKVILNTYPIYSMPFELSQNRAFFDNHRITSDLQTYLVKKFFNRWYYGIRDVANPNKPLDDRIIRATTGIVVSYRETPQVSMFDESVAAGLSPSFEAQEDERAKKTREYRDKRAKRVVEKMQRQLNTDPKTWDKSPSDKWDYLWDTLLIPWYAMGAGFHNYVVTSEIPNKIMKPLIDRGWVEASPVIKEGNIGIRDKKTIADYTSLLRAAKGLIGKPVNPRNERGDVIYQGGWEGGFWDKMFTNTATDPSRFASLVATGSKIMVRGKAVVLSSKGVAAQRIQNLKHGEREGYWKFVSELKKHPEYIQAYGLYLTGTNIGIPLVPAIAAIRTSAIVSSITKPVIQPIREAINGRINLLKNKVRELHLAENSVRVVNVAKVRLSQVARRKLPDLKKADEVAIKASYDATINDIRAKKQLALAEIDVLEQQAITDLNRGITRGFTEKLETGASLTEKEMRHINIIEDLFEQMAEKESQRGLLTSTREGYVRRVLTPKARAAMSLEDKKILELLDPNAGFNIRRKYEGTTNEVNKIFKEKKGFEFDTFDTNVYNSLRRRTEEHIEAIGVSDYLAQLKKDQGVDLKYRWQLTETHGRSRIPLLNDVLLPKETIKVLEEQPLLKQHIKTITPPRTGASEVLRYYDSARKFYQYSVTAWFAAFYTRNMMSARFVNWQHGVKNPAEDIATFKALYTKSGKGFTTKSGKTYTYDEFMNAAREDGVLSQPGFIGREDIGGFTEWSGRLPRWIIQQQENFIRLELYKHRLIEGDERKFAKKYVEDYHMNYNRELSKVDKVGLRFIPFYIWNTGNPKAQVLTLLTRPGSYAMVPKVANSWNTQQDKAMLEYKPDHLKGTVMMKVPNNLPGADDAFWRIPMAFEDISMLQGILQWQSHAFYWEEALRNPDMVRAFARSEELNEWLIAGGGVAKKDQFGNIRIEYKNTGQSITAALSSDKSKLQFINDETKEVIKEYGVESNINGKREVRRDNEPYLKLAGKYLYSWFMLGAEGIGAVFGDPIEDWRTGRIVQEDELNDWFFNNLGGGRFSFTLEEFHDKNKPQWEKNSNLLGLRVYHAQDWMNLPPEIKREVARQQIRKIKKQARGCGW